LGAPRQTRRDRWAKRKSVENYHTWKDALRIFKKRIPDISTILSVYYLCEMPESWSDKKKAEHFGTFHRVKPDIDNGLKAIMDALLKQDQSVAVVLAVKIYSYENAIFFFGYEQPADLRGRLDIHLQQMPGVSDCEEGRDVIDPGAILYDELQVHQQRYIESKARVKNGKRPRFEPKNEVPNHS